MKKSREIHSELDYNQEFFLAGLHTRQLSLHCMGASSIIMGLLIQLAGKTG